MKVLITGGLGFLGRHLTRSFLEAGARVVVVDIAEPPEGSDYEAVRSDAAAWLDGRSQGFDVIVHLAASIGGRTGIEALPFDVARNTSLDAAVFNFAVRTDSGRVVYVSSSAAYPVERQERHIHDEPLAEDEVDVRSGSVAPADLTYGWWKRFGEYMACLASERYQLPVTVYRPFTVYGPWQSSDYPMTAISLRAIRREDPLHVWGTGHQCRDLVFIEDFVRIVEHTYDVGEAHRPLNVASGLATSMLQAAEKAAGIVGYDPAMEAIGERPQGVLCRVGSPNRLPRALRPATPVATGIGKLISCLDGAARDDSM